MLDRLYGYRLSPLLWKKVAPKLSAGRVQSVAVRLIVQRELERRAFRTGTYWDLKAALATGAGSRVRGPALHARRASASPPERISTKRTGQLKPDADVLLVDEPTAAGAARTAAAAAAGASPISKSGSRSASRILPSRPARCSRKPTASWECRPARRCRSPSGCTKTATSPTCEPTRSRCRKRRFAPPAARIEARYGDEYLSDGVRTLRNEDRRGPRKPTKRSARPAPRCRPAKSWASRAASWRSIR